MFLEEGGTCAILRQTSSTPTKPLCDNQGKTTETCNRAINWQSPSSNPIDAGVYPPMGESIELQLHKIMGEVIMATSPGATVDMLINKAANNETPSPSEKAFIEGASKAMQRKSTKSSPWLKAN